MWCLSQEMKVHRFVFSFPEHFLGQNMSLLYFQILYKGFLAHPKTFSWLTRLFNQDIYITTYIYITVCNAGINLTGYQPLPPPPGHTGAFAPKRVPSPRAFAQQKMSRAGPINDDVPGAGHLHQHEDC